MLLTDFDALTFDCYGTLIDWESGMVEALKGLTDRVQRPLTHNQILGAHARHESSQQHYTPAKRYRSGGKLRRAHIGELPRPVNRELTIGYGTPPVAVYRP